MRNLGLVNEPPAAGSGHLFPFVELKYETATTRHHCFVWVKQCVCFSVKVICFAVFAKNNTSTSYNPLKRATLSHRMVFSAPKWQRSNTCLFLWTASATEPDFKSKDWVFLNYTYKRFEGLTQRGTIPTYMKAGKAWRTATGRPFFF